VPKIRRLRLDELRIDSAYQRPLNERTVRTIAQGFDGRRLGVLVVSKRDGWYAVFDGQHRLAALRKLGALDALCQVHENLAQKDEAWLFARLQLDRRSLRPIDRFKAQLVAEDPAACEIDQIVRDHGLRIGGNGRAPSVQAIVSLEKIYARGGGALLRDVLGLIQRVWRDDDGSTHGQFLEGTAIFVTAFGPKIGPANIESLGKRGPWTIIRRSTAHSPEPQKKQIAVGVAMELRAAAKMKRVQPVRFTRAFGAATKISKKKRPEKETA
jgi:hypothetical protein